MGTENLEIFSIASDKCLIEEHELGVVNGHLATNVTCRDVLSFRSLYAPPFVSSDFVFEIRLGGEKVPTEHYTWYPFETVRQGGLPGLGVTSDLVLAAGQRAVLLAVTIENRTATVQTVPLQCNVIGGFERCLVWPFAKPIGDRPCTTVAAGSMLVKSNEAGAIAIGTSLKNMVWHPLAFHWETVVRLEPKQTHTFAVAVVVGKDPQSECARMLEDSATVIREAREAYSRKITHLFTQLPVLEASDQRLQALYNRSLVHFLLNQWDVPEFKLHPYFSTGAINGGCVCCYLWDFGGGWEIFSLYAPEAAKEHLKAFLSIDLTRHFAFLPITGEGIGSWYHINQEKIIFHIYHYVCHTGDVGFLDELVDGKPVIDHVLCQALVGDDLSKDAVLIDYGGGNHHLELRREYRYDHVLPDMNGRRYAYYLAAWELCQLVGKEAPDLPQRAAALRKLVKARLWNRAARWFHWLDREEQPHTRYTVQMFKLFGSGVLDEEQEAGLLSHLNEREFLSDYGLHSMSNLDPAYDQIDIDNGGGGGCPLFLAQVSEKLYRAGHPERGEDLYRRALWWGDRLAYWADSLVANNMDYRRDTPLQSNINSVSLAQSMIFGMFGVAADLQGRITVNPVPPSFSPRIRLTGLKIRGRSIDIEAGDGEFTVTTGGRSMKSNVGRPVVLEPEEQPLHRS